jgi:hypothetical protein
MIHDCVNKKAYTQIEEYNNRHTSHQDPGADQSVLVLKQKKGKGKQSRGKVGCLLDEKKAQVSALPTSFLNGGESELINLMVMVPSLFWRNFINTSNSPLSDGSSMLLTELFISGNCK